MSPGAGELQAVEIWHERLKFQSMLPFCNLEEMS